MVFPLIADDRDAFDRLWRWSVDHLGDGRLDDKLPAWQWGHRDNDGTWGVMDLNSAADADLWFVFALDEASRLWNGQVVDPGHRHMTMPHRRASTHLHGTITCGAMRRRFTTFRSAGRDVDPPRLGFFAPRNGYL